MRVRGLGLWGAAARNALRQETFTEHEEELRLTSLIGKARARIGRGTTSLLAQIGEKLILYMLRLSTKVAEKSKTM